MSKNAEPYFAFWKPKKERMKDVCKVLKHTGIFNYSLMKNYWPFSHIGEVNYN